MTKPKKEAKRWFELPTDYPNGLVEGVPYEVFDAEDAEQGLKDLEEIKSLVKNLLVF